MMVTFLDYDARREPKTECYCVKCQRDIKDPANSFWVKLVEVDSAGPYVLHPQSVMGEAKDLGFFRIGADCAKQVGMQWVTKERPEETPSEPVFFYEREFYVLSNFSSFMLESRGLLFPTSEHAYHFEKFFDDDYQEKSMFSSNPALVSGFSSHPQKNAVQREIVNARSAHDSQKIAQQNRNLWRSDWDSAKVEVMRQILRLKVAQHPYVMKKLMETGDREIIEDSWRDDYWGWGVKKDGLNKLGKLWMEIREEIRKAQ